MASHTVLRREQAIAMQEAIGTIEGLLGEESPRLYAAQHDAVGKTLQDFVSAMVDAELVRVVATLHAEMQALKEKLAASSGAGKTKK